MTHSKTIVVTGDVVTKHDIFAGTRTRSDASNTRGTTMLRSRAGAYLVHEVLKALMAQDCEIEVALGVDADAGSEGSTEYRLWSGCSRGRTMVWGLTRRLGYGTPDAAPARLQPRDASADILVIEDAGIGFRHDTQKQVWPEAVRTKGQPEHDPELIVYRMGSPVGQGDLWRAVSSRFADRTVLVVSIEDIRREAVRVTRGVSWERTATELMCELADNPAIKPLLACRTLVVSFGSDGALIYSPGPDGKATAKLLFDPEHLEGEWAALFEGSAPDRLACLVSGITHQLSSLSHAEDTAEGVRAGLSAKRRLIQEGYGPIAGSGPGPGPGFPTASVVAEILEPGQSYGSVALTTEDARPGSGWAILSCHGSCRPLHGLGRRVALLGTKALGDAPYARFGKLLATDRGEIEGLRNIRQLIRDYERNDKGSKPLSIAVFGPPGSGKSFSIEEIAESALGKGVTTLVFNLSQFAGPEELAGALHQVRDRVLAGRTPVVFWDEFDSREFYWLQYLLAPMQDGAFREGQLEHRIGKCIFVFAGGTSPDFEHFGPSPGDEGAFKAFRMKKGPDFKSRLAGYLNVLGPNRRTLFDAARGRWIADETDVCAPVRRGLLLRVMLGLYGNERLHIDPGILSGLLELDEYKHGARSLQTIVSFLKHRMTDGRILRSDLPPAEVVSLHADYDDFMRRVNWDLAFESMAEALAPAVHGYYEELVKTRDELLPYRGVFEKLPEGMKDDNRAAAARIPRVLRMAGLYVVPCTGPDDKTTPEALDVSRQNIELLAEAEHEGWMEHRRKNGWVYGTPRDDKARIHPQMKPYSHLDDDQRDKDRNSVNKYPPILDLAGFKIVTGLPE